MAAPAPPEPKVADIEDLSTREGRRATARKELEALELLKEKEEGELEELQAKKRAEIAELEERIAKAKAALEEEREEGETFEEFQARKTRELEEIEELERRLEGIRREHGLAPEEGGGAEGPAPPATLEEALEGVPVPGPTREAEQAYLATTAQPREAYIGTAAQARRNYESLYDVARGTTLDRLRDLNYTRGNWSQRDVEDYDRIKYEVQRVEEVLQVNAEQKYFRTVSDEIMEQFDSARKFLRDMGYRR